MKMSGGVFRWLILPAMMTLCSLLWLTSRFRLSALVFLLAFLGLYLFQFLGRRPALMAVAWLLFLVAMFLPVDVSLVNYPGPPRFVPLVMGMPGPKLSEQARRGEVMLGGCLVRGSEPKWVWVW